MRINRLSALVGMSVLSVAILAGQVVRAQDQATDDFARGAYRIADPDLVAPVLVKHRAPKYTPEAMRQRIQGVVVIEAVIASDGTVARARVKESLDEEYGLYANALEAAKDWTFKPGTYKGEPVAVLVSLNLEFRLH
jgi:TonB family protein